MTEPLSLAEVQGNLRLGPGPNDQRLTDLIVTAREHIEDYTGLVLVPRTITETAPRLGAVIELSSWPITEVTAIRYPLAGVMTALGDGSWITSFKRRPVRILPAVRGWGIGALSLCFEPALPVEVDVNAGFATPGDVPSPVKQAMHLLIAHYFSNRAAAEVGARAAAVELPYGVKELLRRYRLRRV